MGANATVFDAGFWASRASWGREAGLGAAFRSLATFLLTDDRAGRDQSARASLAARRDRSARNPRRPEPRGRQSPGRAPARTRPAAGDPSCAASCASSFWQRSCRASRRRTVCPTSRCSTWRLSLEVPEVVGDHAQGVSARAQGGRRRSAFDEQASYRPRGIDDYGRLETEILEPMEDAYEFVREIGTGISHHFGAFG